MKSLLQRLLRILGYTAATVVILLAIAVGLFRLFLPRLSEYQEEIKDLASVAIGMDVEFSGMDARWGLSGPELEFYDTELIQQDSGIRVLAADEVRVSVGLVRLLVDRTFVVDRVVIRDTSIDVRQLEDGSFRIQGSAVNELFELPPANPENPVNFELIGEDVEVRFIQPGDERPHFFAVPEMRVSFDDSRIAADALIRLPEDLGRQLKVAATQIISAPAEQRRWDISMDAVDIRLAGWSQLSPGAAVFGAGVGDLDLALAWSDGRVVSASADLDFVDVALVEDSPFDIVGRIESDVANDGWLLAANDLVLSFADHVWPKSSLRLEASTDPDGSIVIFDARASYLNLDDLALLDPLLSEQQRQQFAAILPSGVIRDLIATVSEVDTDAPRYDVTAELFRVGMAPAAGRPGVRGFSGTLRANRSGGRLEIDAENLAINVPDLIDVPIELNLAVGTVIWRSSSDHTTVLSDSIRVSSDIFDSQSNVQLILGHDGTAPEIDLSSNWSIADVAAAKRYIPRQVMKPKLYDWFQSALLSGSIPHGTTELKGPLDKFPFDAGEGRMLINAAIRNMTFKYHAEWPAADDADLDVVLDNAHLYSTSNRSTSAGNSVVNAKVDIADLRDPVLEIESLSTGTLESIRQFSLQSPIAKVFGGQLDRVTVSGDASFTLALTVPLKNVQEFEFVSHVRSNSGTLSIVGFDPPITDLIGEVTIERDQISAQSLGGRFLGEAVDIALARSEDPQFAVVATANGVVTADALINELGAPLQGLMDGRAAYQANIFFPVAKVEIPSPLTIQIESDLQGLQLDLPVPVGKVSDASLQVAGDIRFLPGGNVIESTGVAEDRVAWQLAFNRPEDAWDFDRGIVTLDGAVTELADTRGLHIRGTTETVRFEDWMALSRGAEKKVNAAERIRSIDILVDDLYILGQHLRDHRVRVDRSALDWLVQVDGEDVAGSVFVPYDFGGERAMVLEMQKLRLPGGDDNDSSDDFDPRALPPITLSADEFAFGDRYLGAVTATIEKTGFGLDATSIHSKDTTFEIVGTGRWIVDDEDPLGSRSIVTATLTSSDVEETMRRLNYEPGIRSDSMGMLFDLSWSGGPRADFFASLDGAVQVRLESGQLREVDPGAGRMFGLMSITALPRRLSLDFRDVFGKGFGFDKVAGTFRIVDGITYTCDLALEGPAADIGIVGAADLENRTYEQTAIVGAKVGNTLPIVGAVVAGPQVAAALFLFSAIFKKPLQEAGQVYYGIAGSWDEPDVESTNSAAFVQSSELAGCLQDAAAQ